MMNVLRLTGAELERFQALPDALKEGWKTEEEDVSAAETGEELFLRYRIAHFTDPMMKKLADSALKAKTAKEMDAIIASFNITNMPQDQMAELFFVLGTRVVSAMVEHLLAVATTNEDLEGVAGITMIRKMLLEANSDTAA